MCKPTVHDLAIEAVQEMGDVFFDAEDCCHGDVTCPACNALAAKEGEPTPPNCPSCGKALPDRDAMLFGRVVDAVETAILKALLIRPWPREVA